MSNASEDQGFFFDEEPDPEAPSEPEPKDEKKTPAKRGRPKGSRNTQKESLLTKKRLESLYNRVQPYLPADQRKYTKGIMDGTAAVDPKRELELLIRQLSILFSEASVWYWNEKRISRDLAQFADSLRAAIKDLSAINKYEEEMQAKENDVATLDDAERRNRVQRINELLEIEDIGS